MQFSRLSLITVLMLILIAVPLAAAALPAFPGAEGFGSATPGGRGGQVYVVTTLDADGEGSLRKAVEASGPRIVVFAVSGYIDLPKTLNINNPYLTIAGQTAPGDGVTVRGEVAVKTHDVVIRYMRFRPLPPATRSDLHALRIDHDAYRVVVDHCSLSYGIDENFAMFEKQKNPPRDATVQWSIISYGLANEDLVEADERGQYKPHSMGALFGGPGVGDVSFHHNLLAHNDQRSPRLGGSGTYDLVNNVVYNYGYSAGAATDDNGLMKINYVRNFVKKGPNSGGAAELNLGHVANSPSHGYQVYVEGNIGPHRTADTQDQKLVVNSDGWNYVTGIRNSAPPVTTSTARDAYEQVLRGAGAIVPRRDGVDEKVVRDVRESGGRIIRLPTDDAGYPALPQATAPTDTDSDGMPDTWETERGLNPQNKGDAAVDRDGDGYTNIEEYLNAAPVYVGAVTIPGEGGAFPGERVRFTTSSHARSTTDAIGEMRFLVSTNLREETYQFYGRVTQVQPGSFQASIKTYSETDFTGAVPLGVGAPRRDGTNLANRYIRFNTGESWVTVDPLTKTITVTWDVTFLDAYGKRTSQSVFTYVAGRNGEQDTGKYQPVDNYGWHRKGTWSVWDPNYAYRYGFFQEAYLESDGVHTQGRMCALTAGGAINPGKCEPWKRDDLTNAIDRIPRKFAAYDAFVFTDQHQKGWVSQSLIEADGRTSWARTCPIFRNTGVDWKPCPWQKVDLSGTGLGKWKAYAATTLTEGATRKLTQSAIGDDLVRSWYRTCPNSAGGAPDTNRCSAWAGPSDVPTIRGLEGRKYMGYTSYTVGGSASGQLVQRMLASDGLTEKIRTCTVSGGRPDWNGCDGKWSTTNLLTSQNWARDPLGKKPSGFTELGVVYYYPKGETVPVAFEPRT